MGPPCPTRIVHVFEIAGLGYVERRRIRREYVGTNDGCGEPHAARSVPIDRPPLCDYTSQTDGEGCGETLLAGAN